jgi:hypothetical protein
MTGGGDSDMKGTDMIDVVVSGLEPVATSSSSLLNMDEDNRDEFGGSLSTSSLKRKRSYLDIVVQDDDYTTAPGVCFFCSFSLTR